MFRYPGRRPVSPPQGGPSMTHQSFKAECDINNILAQYKRTGMIQHIAKQQPRYEELPDAIDYQQSLHLVMQAEQTFADLPSKVRDRFNNDPVAFLEFFNDKGNEAELREWGFLKPLQQPAAPATTPAPPAPS